MVPKTLHRFNTDCLRLDNWITIAPKIWNLEKNSAVSNEHRGTRTQIKNDGRRWAQWVLEPRPSCQPMWALRKTNAMDRDEARSEKTLVPDFIVYTLDSKFPSKALINNTVIWFEPWCLCKMNVASPLAMDVASISSQRRERTREGAHLDEDAAPSVHHWSAGPRVESCLPSQRLQSPRMNRSRACSGALPSLRTNRRAAWSPPGSPARLPLVDEESRAAWIPAWLPARLPPRRGRIAGRRGFPLRSRRGSPKARMQDDEDDGAAIFGGRRKYREDERAVDREGRLIRGVRSNGSQRTSVN